MYLIQPRAAKFITAENLSQIMMLCIMILSFVLAFKDTVNVLYMSGDLEPLLPLPFSASQIVTAKLVIVSSSPVLIGIGVLNYVCLGYGIREGAGITFVIGTLLSSILIPVTGISAATLLVVLIFRLFGFIRNRDVTVALSGLLTFGLIIAHTLMNNMDGGKVTSSLDTISSVSKAFPNISFMNRFMFGGDISGLLISLIISAAVILLAVLAVRAFYLDTALSMQNTSTKSKPVSDELIRSNEKTVR